MRKLVALWYALAVRLGLARLIPSERQRVIDGIWAELNTPTKRKGPTHGR